MLIPLREVEARRIALIKPSALGDIVNSLPVLAALRVKFPTAHLAWVVNRSYAPLLQGHPDLNDLIAFDRGAARKNVVRGAWSYAAFLSRLRREQFDLVFDLQGLLRSGAMTGATGAARRVGLSTAREGAVWFYTDVVPVADFDAIHAVDRYWLVAEALGLGAMPKRFHVPIDAASRQWAAEALCDCPRPWLALAVGSRWMTKRWPTAHFATLVRQAQERHGGTALFVGGADETPLAQQTIAQLRGPWRDLSGQTSLPRLAAVLAAADVLMANDTGPLHLATALGRPVVAPYTCTKVRLNGPYGAAANAIESTVYCQGSYLRKCSRLDCMAELTPDRLWPILRGILDVWQHRSLSA